MAVGPVRPADLAVQRPPSVLQRQAAAAAPPDTALHLSLFSYLIRRKVWLAGIGMVILAAVAQAAALATGPIALVQPIFIIELPFTLLLASKVNRRPLPPTMTWGAVALVTVSLGIGLAAAAPSGGLTTVCLHENLGHGPDPDLRRFEAVVITVVSGPGQPPGRGPRARGGLRLRADRRPAEERGVGPGSRASGRSSASWQLYATAVAGVGALFLLQNGLQAGSLVAVQPPLTLGDALISACYGVTVFGEDVQTGGWLLVVQIVAVIAVAIGCIELSRSLALVHVPQPMPN